MEILIKASQLLLSLSFLVLIHEMGHFFFARLFKTRVEKFYLFFDPWFSLFKTKRGDTEYGIGWLPLGGYVKISGMIDESMDMEQMKQPAQPYEFRSKKAWQRLLIMLGGVLVNFFAALFIYAMVLYTWGEQYLPTKNVKYGISVDSLAYEVGFRNGDKIISVDNKEIENFSKIVGEIILEQAKTVQVSRDSEVIDIQLPSGLTHKFIKANNADFISYRYPFEIGDFVKESAALKAGLQKGDRLIGINGTKAEFYNEFKKELAKYKDSSVAIQFLRNEKPMEISIAIPSTGLLGVAVANPSKFFELKETEYGFFQSIPAGIDKGFNTMSLYVKQFKLIFSKDVKGYESLGGFMTIGSIFPSVWDWESFWSLTAFLSIILAIMNILPIPALDGGHVMFLMYEIITRRKPSDKFLEYAQITGFVLILALVFYANLNDIIRFFF